MTTEDQARPRVMKITVTRDDGTTADITEGVRVAYDAVIQPIWAEGQVAFSDLDEAEQEAVSRLAEVCGFQSPQDAAEQRHLEWVAAGREQDRLATERREELARLAEQDRIDREQFLAGQTREAWRGRIMQQMRERPTTRR